MSERRKWFQITRESSEDGDPICLGPNACQYIKEGDRVLYKHRDDPVFCEAGCSVNQGCREASDVYVSFVEAVVNGFSSEGIILQVLGPYVGTSTKLNSGDLIAATGRDVYWDSRIPLSVETLREMRLREMNCAVASLP